MNLRDIKKDIEYVIGAFVDDSTLFLNVNHGKDTQLDRALQYITELGYSKEFGARNIARTVEDEIADKLVDEVLFGKLEKGGDVTADIKNSAKSKKSSP